MKKIIIFILIIFAISVTSFVAMKYINNINITQNKVFNKEMWNANINDRKTMTDDLIKNYKLKGMKRKEIIDLLGNNGVDIKTSDYIEYIIGQNYIDELGLRIYFDKNDIVTDYKISPH